MEELRRLVLAETNDETTPCEWLPVGSDDCDGKSCRMSGGFGVYSFGGTLLEPLRQRRKRARSSERLDVDHPARQTILPAQAIEAPNFGAAFAARWPGGASQGVFAWWPGGGSKPCCCSPTPTPTPCSTTCCSACDWQTLYPTLYVTDQYQTTACVYNAGNGHWIGCYLLSSVAAGSQTPCGCEGLTSPGSGTYVTYTIACSGSTVTITQSWTVCYPGFGADVYCTDNINFSTCGRTADECAECLIYSTSGTYVATVCQTFPFTVTLTPYGGTPNPFSTPDQVTVDT